MTKSGTIGAGLWCVQTINASTTFIEIYADKVEFKDGGVIFWRVSPDGVKLPNLALARGQWSAVMPADAPELREALP